MITNAEGADKSPDQPHSPQSFNPADFPLTEQDCIELRDKRGLSEGTVAAAQLGSVRNQRDLDRLGIEMPFDELPSTVLIPYPPARGDGTMQFRLHKRSVRNACYTPYTTPPRASEQMVVAESEFKALAAWQLGYNAIGLQGIESHTRQINMIADAARSLGCDSVVMVLDTVRDVDDHFHICIDRPEPLAALTYAYGLELLDIKVTIAELPKQYLTEKFDSDERKYLRADIDGALAAGMTSSEFAGIITTARTVADFPVPVKLKAAGIWRAQGQQIFNDLSLLDRLLGTASLQERHEALGAIAKGARTIAFNDATKVYDFALLNTVADQLKRLFKKYLPGLHIEDVRQLLSRTTKKVLSILSLEDIGLVVVEYKVFHPISRGQENVELQLVANFTVEEIRTGEVNFVDRPPRQIHQVHVKQGTEGRERQLEVQGSIFDAKNFLNAGGGHLSIASPAGFMAYMAYQVDHAKIQRFDHSCDRTLLVGAAFDDGGKLVPNDNIAFPHETEECAYHLHRFTEEGDISVFSMMAKLFTDSSVVVIMLMGLGSIVKLALGWAFPHTVVESIAGSGKTTLKEEFQRVFDWVERSGPSEFTTSYRTKKTFANCVLPIQIDEVGRVHDRARSNMVEVLNLAFNKHVTTHGDKDKTFVVCAPGILYGQDFGVEDVALNSKIVRVSLDPSKKDPEALKVLRQAGVVWPMKKWVAFVCEYANRHDLQSIVNTHRDRLRERVPMEKVAQSSDIDRVFWNYSVILAIADVVHDFGVEVATESLFDYVASLVTQHLQFMSGAGGDDDRSTTALQFMQDLLLAIQMPAATNTLIFDLEDDGLYFKTQNALDYLRGQGKRYDVTCFRRLQAMLVREGLVKPSQPHRHKGSQTRFALATRAILTQLGFEYDVGVRSAVAHL